MAETRRNNTRFILLTTTAIVAAVSCLRFFAADGPWSHLEAANRAFERQDYGAACEHADLQLQQTPGNSDAIIIGADAAEKSRDVKLALAFLKQLPPTFDKAEQIRAWRQRARLLRHIGRVTDSCAVLETILHHVPDDLVARRWLCQAFSDCGFEFEAVKHARLLMLQGSAAMPELALLARNGRGRLSSDQLDRQLSQHPDDQMPFVGLLRLAERQRNAAEIDFLLSDADTRFSEPITQLECFRIASALISASSPKQRLEVAARLRELHQHDDVPPKAWLVTADWAKDGGRLELQQSCLAQVVRMDPWNAAAIHGLANSLQTSAPALANRFFELFEKLQQIGNLASQAEALPPDSDNIRVLATKLAEIGRSAEASGWARLVRSPNAQAPWAAAVVTNTPLTTWRHPIEDVGVADVTAALNKQLRITQEFPPDTKADTVAMIDCAKEAGLTFQYINGQTPGQQGLKMHQWTGGGIGVVDFDHDSWPDLYLSQGGQLNQPPPTSSDTDAMFRNLRGHRFVSAASAAGLREVGYGQGVAVGDVNQDGFDDIYVANVGVNRLLTSQGDGTFIATDLDAGDAAWTTSVAIADLNHDMVPDLYDVNYLYGEDVFTKTCEHSGLQRICGPTDFSAEPDRLLLSDGTGAFAAAQNLPVGTEGRGMGVLVGALTMDTGNQIYIANDESANQLFVSDHADQTHRFYEVGVASGMAFDYYGASQGSMGIASGDTNNDGLLDVFVTNYYAEQNTLYQQQQGATFLDATSTTGLAGPGYSQLGFGCQFLDIQADGLLDLVIANGHLDDFTHEGQPYRMLPQVFLNAPDGRFRTVQPASVFFRTPALGRAIAKLDWNRDGRCDLVFGHLDQPIALATNQTPATNPTIAVHLVGTNSSRSSVGALMSALVDDSIHTSWVTSGDGYQSSNERLLRFAVPSQPDWEVKWADRTRQRVSGLTPGTHCVIQGRASAYSVPR